MTFKASQSFWIKAVTIALAVGLTPLAVGTFLADGSSSAMIIPILVIILVFGLSYYFSIRSYEIADDALMIHRRFDTVKIPKSAVKEVIRVEKKDLRLSVRTFGIGGVFAYTGQFWNGKFGSMTWYLTRMDCAVMLIDSRGTKTVISPDNPEGFIAALNLGA